MDKKKEKKEKVYSIEEELNKEIETTDADIVDPTDKPKPKEKF
jgi:hypothetical protein